MIQALLDQQFEDLDTCKPQSPRGVEQPTPSGILPDEQINSVLRGLARKLKTRVLQMPNEQLLRFLEALLIFKPYKRLSRRWRIPNLAAAAPIRQRLPRRQQLQRRQWHNPTWPSSMKRTRLTMWMFEWWKHGSLRYANAQQALHL